MRMYLFAFQVIYLLLHFNRRWPANVASYKRNNYRFARNFMRLECATRTSASETEEASEEPSLRRCSPFPSSVGFRHVFRISAKLFKCLFLRLFKGSISQTSGQGPKGVVDQFVFFFGSPPGRIECSSLELTFMMRRCES